MWDDFVGRAAASPEIDTPAKRRKLEPRRNPFWISVAGGRGGLSIGYRRQAQSPGSWVAKMVAAGRRIEERLGQADDDRCDDDALGYKAALAAVLEWGNRQAAAFEESDAGPRKAPPTVRSAVESYILKRLERSASAGANAKVRLVKHVLGDKAFADVLLRRLRASTIESWRKQLAPGLAPSTVNRLLNDVRAALNDACEQHRRTLPVGLPGEIRTGTRALSVRGTARKQILDEAQLRVLLEAAWTIEDGEDFGPLVMLAAATGARFSQLAAATVGDVQFARQRIMLPSSLKGRSSRPRPPIPIPLSDGVLRRLASLTEGRAADEPLLQTWAYERAGAAKWRRARRRPWGAACETEKLWRTTIAAAGLPSGTVMYSLRHTSITRGLCAGLPIRLVAAAHDTSVEMIEAHYAAYILDATEDLHRKHALSV